MPSLQIVPTLTCALCDQLIDFERQLLDTSEVVLFGTERFAWCLEMRPASGAALDCSLSASVDARGS